MGEEVGALAIKIAAIKNAGQVTGIWRFRHRRHIRR